MWTIYIVFLAIPFVPIISAEGEDCLATGQCTALDGTTCVSANTTQPEGCDIYKCKLVFGKPTYVLDQLRCEHPNGTCLNENYLETDTGSCVLTTCTKESNGNASFTMRVHVRPYACKLPNGFCLSPSKRLDDFEHCRKTLCKVTGEQYKVAYKYFGCPMNNTCHFPGNVVKGDCMNFKCKIPGNQSSMELKPYGTISCLLENGTCLDKGTIIRDDLACLQRACKVFKYSNGTAAAVTIERFFGCPYEGSCEAVNTIKSDTGNCTTRKCRIFSNGFFMNWKTIYQGCRVGDGCRNHTEHWNEDTESMCVVKSCNVQSQGKGVYQWNTDIVSHGCRSPDGTCHYNGDTWMDDSCFTKNCTVSETEDGGSRAATDTVGGICKAADGSCVEYGEKFLQEEGGPLCDCQETVSQHGYPIGQTSCPIPAL